LRNFEVLYNKKAILYTVVAYIADMSSAAVNWHGCTVPFSGFYLHCFLWCICLVVDNSKDVVSALKSTIFLVQE